MSIRIFIGTALLAWSSQVVAQPFFLSCDLVFQSDGTKISRDYKIDEEKKTVDGNPATFTETAISYSFATSSGDMLTVFSRLTGRVRVTSKSDVVVQGTCVVSNTRKF